MKICYKCNLQKNKIDFYREKSNVCKLCFLKQRKEYYQKNKEVFRKKWQKIKSNPEKLAEYYARRRIRPRKKRKNTRFLRRTFLRLTKSANDNYKDKIKPFELWKLAKQQKMKCALTGIKLTKLNISLDHIIPKCKGGKNINENLQLVIRDINTMKNGLLQNQFIEMCQKVIETVINKQKESVEETDSQDSYEVATTFVAS